MRYGVWRVEEGARAAPQNGAVGWCVSLVLCVRGALWSATLCSGFARLADGVAWGVVVACLLLVAVLGVFGMLGFRRGISLPLSPDTEAPATGQGSVSRGRHGTRKVQAPRVVKWALNDGFPPIAIVCHPPRRVQMLR